MAAMNITLSVDDQLIARARAYAQSKGQSLDELMRDYMRHLPDAQSAADAADEFESLALSSAGQSPPGSRSHRRGR
jgi:hypothetical protein